MAVWLRPLARRAARLPIRASLLWMVFFLLVWSVHSLFNTPPPAAAQNVERGEERDDVVRAGEALWNRDCASCHGPQGNGTRWGPDLQGKGPAGVHLMVSTGRMPIEDLAPLREDPVGEDARQVPRGDVEYLPGQVAALVAYSREIIDGPDVPIVDVAGADVSAGASLFQLNCASCHRWSARGGALTNGHVATSLVQSSPEQVVAAMRTGIGTMPQFTNAVFSDEDAADIAAYVQYLGHPRNEGGYPLAYIGPAAEGLIAWLVGILGLLLFVRWVGQRS